MAAKSSKASNFSGTSKQPTFTVKGAGRQPASKPSFTRARRKTMLKRPLPKRSF